MEPVWQATKSKGFFEVARFDDLCVWLGRFKDGEPLELVIRKPRKHPTDAQRKYYWKVIVGMIMEYTGIEEKEEVHYMLKSMFLCKINKLGLKVVGSTEGDLDTKSREEFHGKCRRWALNYLGLKIPLPNEVDIDDSDIVGSV